MSNQFYNFLSDKIVNYFKKSELKEGDKFSLIFDTEKRVENLYKALKENKNSKYFKYKDYETFMIDNPNGVSLIVAGTVKGVTADYLTTLRNLIAEKETLLNKAILFIYNENLDSLTKGSESITKKGMPLSIEELKKDILSKSENLEKSEKEIVNYILSEKKKEMVLENSSIFDYEELLTIINQNKIEKKDYKTLGLFYDKTLGSYEKKDLEKRIKNNSELYKEIELIQQYGNIEDDLGDKYTEQIISQLKSVDWSKEIEYGSLVKGINNKNGDQILTYNESNQKETLEGLIYWEIGEKETGAGKRKRNIIIFNPNKEKEISLELKFNERLKNEYLKKDKKSISNKKISGKSITLTYNLDKIEERYEDFKLGTITKYTYEFRVLILPFSQQVFNDIKGKWKLKKGCLLISTNDRDFKLNNNIQFIEEDIVLESDKTIDLSMSKNYCCSVKNIEEDTNFSLQYETQKINVCYTLEKDRKLEKTGLDIWKDKNSKEESFILPNGMYLSDDNTIIFQNKEYFLKSLLKKYILLEQEIIKSEGMYFIQMNSEKLEKITLDVSDDLKITYKKIVDYMKLNSTLPSLAFIDEELKFLYTNYVELFKKEMNHLNDLSYQKKKDIMNLGCIRVNSGEKELLLTPLHPLNIEYQLFLKAELNGEILNDSNICKNLNSNNLLPYLYYDNNNLYKVFEQNITNEWKIYVTDSSNNYNESKEYISKLVRGKIEEFTLHFAYLFNINKSAPINITLLNMGKCKEVLQGILDYIIGKLNKKQEPLNINVNIHSLTESITTFEELSLLNTISEIENYLGINLKNKDFLEEEILEIYREKVHFYKREEKDIQYSHLTFYEMEKDLIEISYDDTQNLNTGLSLNGLVSGTSPQYLGQVYKNGFGLKGVSKNKLITLAQSYNTLARVVENSDPYDNKNIIVTAISDNKISKLDNVYKNSHWVTFIEPKVDINFFKEKNESNLLIIHYSDQYTSSSTYDAITVTQKSELYEKIIGEHLNSKNFETELDFNTINKKIINYFNAINGDWLLKLSRSLNESTREKISILSAINTGWAFLEKETENIIWIPVSLEELLRISGGVGLSQKEGLLSARNLGIKGIASDDLLMIGVSKDLTDLKLYIYPLEVKIGDNQNKVQEKAKEQGKVTYKVFSEIFEGKEENNFKYKFYRNFLIQIIYGNIEKLKLYNIGNQNDWNYILDSKIKNLLLNDDYVYTKELEEKIGKFGVISFKKGAYTRSIKKEFDYSQINLVESDGYRFLILSPEEIQKNIPEYQNFLIDEITITEKKELSNILEKVEVEKKNEIIKENKVIENKVIENNNKKIGMKILFGKGEYQKEFKWYPNDTNKLMHTNTGIIGTMGTGKTQFTKSLITQLYKERKNNIESENLGILIFDYKGDYTKDDFVNITNAKILDPYHLPFNPLALPTKTKPLLPLHTASTLKETIVRAFRLGKVQESTLQDLLMDAYSVKGINKVKFDTWKKEAPTLKDVYDLYDAREDLKKGDSLYSALKTIYDFELFEPMSSKAKPLYDVLDGVVVVKLEGYDPSVQNFIVAITLDLFYSQMQSNGHSKINGSLREIQKFILVDEADNFLGENFSSIKKILKEGREYGVGTILSTQLLNHFSTGENDYSDYLNTWVIHKVPKISDKEIKNIFNISNKNEIEEIGKEISNLEKHYSFVKAGNRKIEKIKDYAFWELLKGYKGGLDD